MAATIPVALRSADIARFAQRAAQVESVRPAVAYWCNYWIVQQVLGKGLHNQDDECKLYTTQLMDKLEEMKSRYPGDAAIADDVEGRAYVEQFGMETFERADKTMTANKVSRQTADTFQASATFLELNQIWSPVSPELASRIKYAKFHALRIAKALKAGEDPNLSNPLLDALPTEDSIVLDPRDPEVQDIMNPGRGEAPEVGQAPTSSHHATVENLSEDQEIMHGLASPAATSQVDRSSDQSKMTTPGVATLASQDNIIRTPDAREGSIGGGYFPEVQLPEVPQDPDVSPPQQQPGPMSPSGYITPTTTIPPADARDYYTAPPESHVSSTGKPQVLQPVPARQAQPTRAAPPPARFQSAVPTTRDLQQYVTEEEAILAAQKHAKWAISALNFEDVPTAIKELKLALQQLELEST